MVVSCGCQSEHLRRAENAEWLRSILWLSSPCTIDGVASATGIHSLSVLEVTSLR